MLVDPQLPAETLALVDGFACYVTQVASTAVPEAACATGRHRSNDFPKLHRRVVAAAPVVDVPARDGLRLRMWPTLWLQSRLPR